MTAAPAFRPHNTDLALAEHEARHRAASAKFPRYSDEWYAENAILDLQDVVGKGLMDCYGSFADSMADFYPNLSWTDRQTTQLGLILADPRFPAIAAAIKDRYDFDLEAELRGALAAPAAL